MHAISHTIENLDLSALKSIMLSGIGISDDGAIEFAKFLTNNTTLSALELMSLRSNIIRDNGAANLRVAISKANLALKPMTTYYKNPGKSVIEVKISSCLPNAHYIIFEREEITDGNLKAIISDIIDTDLSDLQNITILHDEITNQDLTSIFDAIRRDQPKYLKSFSISSEQVGDKANRWTRKNYYRT